MQELHGVLSVLNVSYTLKQVLLFFDKVHFAGNVDFLPMRGPQFAQLRREIDYLESRSVVGTVLFQIFSDAINRKPTDRDREELRAVNNFAFHIITGGLDIPKSVKNSNDGLFTSPERLDEAMIRQQTVAADFDSRRVSAEMNCATSLRTVPICMGEFPDSLASEKTSESEDHGVLRIGLNWMPMPAEDSSWQDILDFKADMHDEQWHLRRWLYSLASKNLTEAEIRDEIDWSLSEYTKAMRIHHLKASQSFVEVFLISPLELIENLLKLNLSKITSGFLSVKKRKLELLEAEMKAPGRECAYIFNALARFG